MVGRRSEKVCNVPTDFIRTLHTEIVQYVAGIGDDEVGEVGQMCFKSLDARRLSKSALEKPKMKAARNGRKSTEEGQNKSVKSLLTLFEVSSPKSVDIWRASTIPKSVKLG